MIFLIMLPNRAPQIDDTLANFEFTVSFVYSASGSFLFSD